MALPDLSNEITCAVPKSGSGGFLAQNIKKNEEFMREDLAKSGLTPGQLRAYVDELMKLGEGAVGGYILPYFDLRGRVMRNGAGDGLSMYRVRNRGGKYRYSQPSRKELDLEDLPTSIPYVLPEVHNLLKQSNTLYICEGEKKAASVCNVLGLPAIGIGGCWCWGVNKKLHPWIVELIKRNGVEEVVAVPDGDIRRYDICTAYGTMADELLRIGVGVQVVDLPDSESKVDDLLVEWGVDAEAMWQTLGKLPSTALVVSQDRLATDYGLSVKVIGTGENQRKEIITNDNNITRLLKEHPSFEDIWLNADKDVIMLGGEELEWGVTDHDITCYMQHYFSLHQLKKPSVVDALVSIARKNTRSLFRDWVDDQVWDGVERLKDWPVRLWGCDGSSGVVGEVGLKFFVGMYARMANPGCKMDWMLVTYGGQGIGKSWFADLVTRGNYVSFMASGNTRDDLAKMHKGLIVLIDELDAFSKREMSHWKTMITTHVDTYREPYGRGEVTKARSSVLYGTTNQRTFLAHDGSGQRRFGVLEPRRLLDFDGLAEELGQLWAEAKVLYERGEVRYFELSAEARAVAMDYQGEDMLVEKVREYLSGLVVNPKWVDENEVPQARFPMLDVLRALELDGQVQNRKLTGQLKDILIGLGCGYHTKIRTATTTGGGYSVGEDVIAPLRGTKGVDEY